MDPALEELIHQGETDDEVAAIMRLESAEAAGPRVRVVARFGPIVTIRLRLADIRAVRKEQIVASLKAVRFVNADQEIAVDPAYGEAVLPGDVCRQAGLPATGRGVVVGVLDWGIDFAHPEFLNPDGSTRLLALWDQRGPARGTGNPYGYGRIYSAEEINAALATAQPYAALGYHPITGDPADNGSHGAHVAGIAVGNTVGMAPEAGLVFVHLSTSGMGGDANLGDSATILEGIDFVRRVAGENPLVINLSVGRHGGPHDGLTLVEQGFDYFLAEHPGRAICQSTGNYYEQNSHAAGQLKPGETHTLGFLIHPADRTPNELEVWYSARDTLEVRLRSPDGKLAVASALGENLVLNYAGREIGRLYHRASDPNNHDNHINLFLDADGPAGNWELSLYGQDVVDGRYHAWIERDANCPGCQAQFDGSIASPFSTTGTICNGFRTITVGAYDPHQANYPLAPFSSAGPTRDGRVKPNILSPGVGIRSVRSAPGEAVTSPGGFVRKSGTSMAAPRVTGTVALMFEAAGRPLAIEETRRLLLQNAAPWEGAPEEQVRTGNGYLDPQRAVMAAAGLTGFERMVRVRNEDSVFMAQMREEVEEMVDQIEHGEATDDNEIGWVDANEVERGCASDDCAGENEAGDAGADAGETIQPIGNLVFGGATYRPTAAAEKADFSSASLDEALKFALRQTNRHCYITGALLTGCCFEVFICRALTIPPAPAVIQFAPVSPVAALVLGGSLVYVPADPLAPGSRYVRLSGAREFYGMGNTLQNRQRRNWIEGRRRNPGLLGARTSLAIPGVTVNRSWLQCRSMPELRLLIAHFAAAVLRVVGVNQPAKKFLGGETFGLTSPQIRLPLTEPECYLPVIAEAEGMMETINGYDLRAGISVGPTQFNCIEGILFVFLKRVWDEDNTLFLSAFAGLNWSMRTDGTHADLVVNAGAANEIILHGVAADRDRNVGFFHSGIPGNHQFAQIDAAFRRDMVARFRALVAWPHIQEMVAEVSAQVELAPALPIIHAAANGIGLLAPANLDCDLFVLKALLISTFVRFSACLRPFLAALRAWNTIPLKRGHWQNALFDNTQAWGNCTLARRQDPLLPRLTDQEVVAQQVCQGLRILLAPAPAPAGAPAPVGAPAGAGAPAAGAGELMEWLEMAGTGDLNNLAQVEPVGRDGRLDEYARLVELAGDLVSRVGTAQGSPRLSGRSLVENVLSVVGAGKSAAEEVRLGLPPLHEFFNTVTRSGLTGRMGEAFGIVGLPGDAPVDAPQTGDLLLRRGENGFAHAAFLVSGELYDTGELAAAGLMAESLRPGRFAQVVEGGSVAHTPAHRFVRRVLDGAGRLPSDSLLLRLRLPAAGPLEQAHIPAGEEYLPERGRRYTPRQAAFRCAPDTPTLETVVDLPQPTNMPDDAIRAALAALGLSAAQITTFENQHGFVGLRPIAARFGAAGLEMLLRMTRYTPGQIANPPTDDDSLADAQQRLGIQNAVEMLAPRVLLAIPGFFRELARRAPDEIEAHALESLGWLIMNSLRRSVNSASGRDWWLPAAPPFVTVFANPVPWLSSDVTRLVISTGMIDTIMPYEDYQARFNLWKNGLAGRAWRLETGLEASTLGSGLPFYPELVTLPAAVNIDNERQQIHQVWQQRLHKADQDFPTDLAARTRSLTQCDNSWLTNLHLLGSFTIPGLDLVEIFPARAGARRVRSLTGLRAIQPIFEQVFRTLYELGWNDLVFETAGLGCFRGTKIPNDPQHPNARHQAARRMSNHSLGIAVDLNVFENKQPRAGSPQAVSGSMSPRVVALFEAFQFRWGKCFNTADPMHFEYCGTGC